MCRPNLNRKYLHLLLQVAFSLCLLRGVACQEDNNNNNCQTCLDLWQRLSEIEGSTRKCKNKCNKDQNKGKFVLDPPCNKKKCCKALCKSDNGLEACTDQGYCTATTNPPTPSPTQTLLDDCPEKLGCVSCLERGCFFGLNGGGACSDCAPQRDFCGTDEGGLCAGYDRTPEGRDMCVAAIGAECGV